MKITNHWVVCTKRSRKYLLNKTILISSVGKYFQSLISSQEKKLLIFFYLLPNQLSRKETVEAFFLLRSYLDQNDLDMHNMYEIGGQLSFNFSRREEKKWYQIYSNKKRAFSPNEVRFIFIANFFLKSI